MTSVEMSDVTRERELWCLIEGETTPFSVPASDVSIYKLKKVIKDNIKVDLDAHHFTLWKPKELDPADPVLDVFQPPTPKPPHLDVLVQIPTSTPQDEFPSKKYHLGDITILLWLKEVHSKIWGKHNLKGELFREVTVTQAHYDELQRLLNEQIDGRDSANYDGSFHHVQSVKLHVLRLNFPANPPRRPDNNEDRVDDDDAPEASDGDESGMDVDEPEASDDGGSTNDTIFPFTLRFMDLSTLALRRNISHRLPLPLSVRQEYDDISRLIEDRPVSPYGSVIVSGQPGTGKTAYLHLRVIESMIEGRPFLYQDLDRNVYHINEGGVWPIQSWLSGDIVAFVDGDRKNYELTPMLLNGSVQIILASNPKGAHEKWTDNARNLWSIVTKPWSPHELFIAGIFLYPRDILFKFLEESTLYFGYNPRRCFDAASSKMNLVKRRTKIEWQITGIASNESNMLQVLKSSRRGDKVSHSIFEISPKDASRSLYECNFSYVSRWAFDYLLEEYETNQPAAATKFYRLISVETDAASLWGCVFERLVFKHLAGIGAEQGFRMRGLSEPIRGQTTWTFRGPIPRSNFRTRKDFIHAITHAVENENPLHLVPRNRNFAAVDSIVYDPNEVLTCIQITVSSEHDISVFGLQRTQSWLKPSTLLGNLRPSSQGPWRIIFIVPSAVEASFDLQALEGDTDWGEWAGKVHQYVLGLDIQSLTRVV